MTIHLKSKMTKLQSMKHKYHYNNNSDTTGQRSCLEQDM